MNKCGAVALWCFGLLMVSGWTPTHAVVRVGAESQQSVKRLVRGDHYVIVLDISRSVRTSEELLEALPADLSHRLRGQKFQLLFSKPRSLGAYEAWVQFEVDQSESGESAVEAIQSSGLLMDVHNDFEYQGEPREALAINDPLFSKQKHHVLMRSQTAWNFGFGLSSIVVAVTDDGVDIDHEDLKNSIWTNKKEIPDNGIDDDENGYIDDVYGWDFSSNDNDPRPSSSFWGVADHGTHVAGIIAAEANNRVGISGAAPRVKVMPLRFYGSGAWTSSVIARTYAYAVDNGARIISTSYNVDGFVGDAVYEAALDYAHDNGVLVFNSAGNNGQKNPRRQIFDQMLLVCSTEVADGKEDVRSDFSNYGTKIDLCAPGSDILSTVPKNGYEEMSGTSMATPNAAGVAALIWSAFPGYSRDQVASMLLGTSDSITEKNSGLNDLLGTGRVNAMRGILSRPRAPVIFGGELGQKEKSQWVGVAQIKVRLAGIFSKPSIENIRNWRLVRETEAATAEGEESLVPISLVSTYKVGTNELVFETDEVLPAGSYRFIGRTSAIKDPFNRPVESESGAGDEFVYSFEAPEPVAVVLPPSTSDEPTFEDPEPTLDPTAPI